MTTSRWWAAPTATGAGIAVALLLASCTSTAPAPSSLPSSRAVAPSREPASSSPTASPSPSVTETDTFLRDPETSPWGVTLVPRQSLLGHLTNVAFPVQVPRDAGPIEYAEGSAITEGSKVVAYRVAPGDVYDFIAKRFHLTNDGYLIVLNEVRRGEAAPLYAGDVLNLSASTLHEYGTVNGRVVRGPEPFEAPPQER